MANWLQKLLLPPDATRGSDLPTLQRRSDYLAPFTGQGINDGRLPNASLIYGTAASALGVISIYFLFSGQWFTGLLLLLPAGCFLGFALHFLKGER